MVRSAGSVAPDDPELGGQHHLVATAGDGPPDQLLVEVGTVHVRGVEEGRPRGRGPGGWWRSTRRRHPARRTRSSPCSRAPRRRPPARWSQRACRCGHGPTLPVATTRPAAGPRAGSTTYPPTCAAASRARRRPLQLPHGDVLVRGVGQQRVPGSEVGRRYPVGPERRCVGPPLLGQRGAAGGRHQSGQQRVVEGGRCAGGGVDQLPPVPRLEHRLRANPAADASACSTVRSGANRWLTSTVASSGTTLPATPPATSTTWSCSTYSQPSSTGSPALDRRPRRSAAGPAGGWRCDRCRVGRCGPGAPAREIRTRRVPWQPASTTPPVGSPRMAASAASRSGRCSHR